MGLSSFKFFSGFSGGLRKTIFFLKSAFRVSAVQRFKDPRSLILVPTERVAYYATSY